LVRYRGGVSKYDPDEDRTRGSFTHFTEKEGLSNNDVRSILEDKRGNFWFGTNGGGVNKYGGKRFTHFTVKEGLGDNHVVSVLEDKRGNLWFSTEQAGVSKYDGKSFTNFTQKEGFHHVWNMLEDKSGNLWFGSYWGIRKYDGKSLTHFAEKDIDVKCMMEDKSGNLWFGTHSGGVSKYDGKNFTRFTEKEGLSNNGVRSIEEDNGGNLWFATLGGLSKYDPAEGGKSFTNFNEKGGLSDNKVVSILKDKSGNLWIGSIHGGVSKYDGNNFTHFAEKDGLSNNNVRSIMEDKNGNLWFGTAFGLNKLEKDKLASLGKATANEAASILGDGAPLFKTYTYEDGFSGISVAWGKTIYEAKDGTIWIAAGDRLTAYHPGEDTPDTIPPNIQLTGLSLFNENISWQNLDKEVDTSIVLGNGVRFHDFHFDSTSKWYSIPEHLSLAYNNNYLTFQFLGITLQSPKKVKYRFKLEGLDKNWSALTNRTEAPYGNLPHGKYTFKVKAMNGDGYWSREFNYSFTIRPPWWQTWWAYTIYALLFITAMYAVYRIQKQRVLRIERERTREHELAQAKEIERAYHELKTTQAQLIQSEKMASLGELTAGIAHEIQNPLNFVKNFSEVNRELIDEMDEEIEKGNIAEVKNIAKDIKENEEKIIHHGERADAIVKGMLQHTRTSTGQKESIDINALADEYLRLSYHGFRAKDKTFNATLQTNFDQSIGKINIVPQDIGRVLLNLYNNAFYAVTEKNKQQAGSYQPAVSVSTKKIGNKVEIKVADNGNGIPQKVLDKIFQPFFTTKPTGQGTGLGLSLSYDIIKAHGGEIKVETKEGEGAEFYCSIASLIN
jgi:signal transduction histidine kinase/streptogramin lyase